MFEWGFWELILVGVVALVVIGPERLPKMARIAGLWIGRARRSLASVRDEINRELKAEELKAIMEKQASTRPLETILEDTIEWGHKPAAGTGVTPAPGAEESPPPSTTSMAGQPPPRRDPSGG
ncbi:MAG: twin-arginine translocase subunit TatB [Sphingobacteriia bacterium]|nr:twin-arginine translocase subunit TatB [Sphingobacteriia bacterium]NCC38603.1 twin-arginine translocase subunit TatB [Gammaproteobacteria bacterium]